MVRKRLIAGYLVAAMCTPGPVYAATLLVPSQHGTIQAGIDAATDGDTVLVASGTYTGTGNWDIDFGGKAIVLKSVDGSGVTTILCADYVEYTKHRGFNFHSGEDSMSVVDGFRVTAADPDLVGGAFYCNLSSPKARNCVLSNFEINGAVFLTGASPIFENCEFKSNSTGWSAGMGELPGKDAGSNGSNAYPNGAAISMTGGSAPIIRNSIFGGNFGDGQSGGAIGCDASSPSFFDCSFTGNSAAPYGGAVYLTNGSDANFYRCQFESNSVYPYLGSSARGGAIACDNSTVTLEYCLIERQQLFPRVVGAGISCVNNSIALISNCDLLDNSSNAESGSRPSEPIGVAIYAATGSTVSVDKSVIAFNTNGLPVVCDGTASIDFSCTDIFGNEGGDWGDCSASQAGLNGNFSADPLFCDSVDGDYRISDLSPCTPANNSCSTLIGAYDYGCTTVSRIPSVFPSFNIQGVAVSTNISVTFESEIDPLSLDSSSLVVHASSSGMHHGVLTYDGPSRTLTLNPSTDFLVGEVVTAVLSPDVRPSQGIPSPYNAFSWSFTIEVPSGSGVFDSNSNIGYAASPNGVSATDFNLDGNVDLVVLGGSDGSVSVLANNGNGTFMSPVGTTLTGIATKLVSSDFDSDGYPDIACIVPSNNEVHVLTNSGSGGASFRSVDEYELGIGLGPFDICAGDFDGDGNIDIATANFASSNVSILFNDGSGRFGSPVTESSSCRDLMAIACGDIDSDGDLDLVVAEGETDYAACVLLNYGNGSFYSAGSYYVTGRPTAFSLVDLDTDGDLDLVSAGAASSISVLWNDGAGLVSPAATFSVADLSGSMTVGDFDANNLIDITTASTGRIPEVVSILMASTSPVDTFLLHTTWPVGSNPRALVTGDLDNDGDLELITANSGSANLTILWNADRELRANPAALSFEVSSADSIIEQVTVAISEIHGLSQDFGVNSDSVWLQTIDLVMTTPGSFAIEVNPWQMSAGTYLDSIYVTSAGAANSPMVIPVTMVVFDPVIPVLIVVDSASFIVKSPEGGGPIERTLQVTISGIPTVEPNLNLANDSAWLLVTPAGGSTDSLEVSIIVTPGSRVPGSYKDTIIVSGSGVTNSPVKVPVTLIVETSTKFTIETVPGLIDFIAFEGGNNPDSVSLNISAPGAAALDIDIIFAESWLSLNPGSGWSLPPDGGTTVYVKVDGTGLATGTHVDDLTISDGAGNLDSVSVPVSFLIEPARQLQVDTDSIGFLHMKGSGVDIGSQTLNISELHDSIVSFSIDSDSSWILITPGTDVTPGDFSVTVDTAGMKRGLYSGTVTVSSDSADVQPIYIAVDLIVDFEITSSDSVGATEDELFTYIVGYSDQTDPADSVVYTDYPSWLTPGAGGSISGIPLNGDTDSSFVVSVYDTTLVPNQTVYITVASVDDPELEPASNPVTIDDLSTTPLRVIVSEGDPTSARLFYRFGGNASWDSVSLIQEGLTEVWTGNVPAESEGLNSFEYYFSAANQFARTLPAIDPEEFPYRAQMMISDHELPDIVTEKWQMIGFPFDLDSGSSTVASLFETVLGPSLDTTWGVARWNPESETYVTYRSLDPIRRKQGFWLRTNIASAILADGVSVPVPEVIIGGAPFDSLTLAPGWNQISNPFAFPVSWIERQSDSEVEATVHEYVSGEGYNAVYNSTGSVLQPFKGYWAKNNATSAKVVLLPYRRAVAASERLASNKSNLGGAWSVVLSLYSGSVIDRTNVFGARYDAAIGRDKHDFSEPPPFSRYVSLASLGGEVGLSGSLMGGDFRPISDGAYQFEILVRGNTGQAVYIEIADTMELAAGYSCFIEDYASGKTYRIATGKRLTLPHLPTPEGTAYRLIVGHDQSLKDLGVDISQMPDRFTLAQNYPNPFNLSTSIEFSLPEPQQVRLEVLNILGQIVRTMQSGLMPAGTHIVEWDGRDESGLAVASGPYLYRLTAGRFVETRKMVLLK